MKSPVAYYLMLLYITVMLKPLLPIATDWWSHEFNEIEHISKVHAVYGSHHLQKEVADTSSENDHNKDQNAAKSEDQLSFHVSPEIYQYNVIVSSSDRRYHTFKLSKPAAVFISNQAPPPKFS